MIEYARHRPAYLSGFEEATDQGRVSSAAELLALPWVAQWKEEHQDERDPERFLHFCWSDHGRSVLLMVQMKASHWVLAYLRGELDELKKELPEWKARATQAPLFDTRPEAF